MSTIESRLAEAINIGDIPALPEVARLAITKTLTMEKSADEISKVIREDPSLTLKIMKMANSPLYTRDRPVSNIKDAIVLLGYRTIKSIILSITIKDVFSARETKKFQHQGFWLHSLAVAHIAEEIARVLRHASEEDAYAAGLLHDIGKVILLLSDEEDYLAVLDSIVEERSSFKNAETKVFGLDHTDVAEFVFKYWDISKKIATPIRDHHKESPFLGERSPRLSFILKIANEIAHIAGFPTQPAEPPYELSTAIVERLGLIPEDLDRIVHTLKMNIDARIDLLNLQRSDTKGYFDTLASANSELGRMFVDNQQFMREVRVKTSLFSGLNRLSLLFLREKNLETVLREALTVLIRAFDFDSASAEFYLNEEKSIFMKIFHPKLFAENGRIVRSDEVEESRQVAPRGSVSSFGSKTSKVLQSGDGPEIGKLFIETEKSADTPDVKAFVDHISLGLSNVRLHLTNLLKTEKLGIAVKQLKEENEGKRKALQLNRLLLDNSPVGILSVDESGKVLTANREAESLFQPDIRDKNLFKLDFLVKNNLEGLFADVIRNRESRDITAAVNGKPRSFHLKTAPVEDTGQTLILISDITERLDDEKALIQKEKMATLGELAAGIAHNLRSPLAVVKGIPEMILSELEKQTLSVVKKDGKPVHAEAEMKENMELITKSLEKVFSIIDSILDLSRTEKGNFKPVAISEAVEDARTLLLHKLREKEIRWSDKTASFTLFGNKTMLTQIFLNLFTNSIEAIASRTTAESGSIEVACAKREDRTVIQVVDNGAGVKEEDLERIFEPFYTHSGKANGTGIGLSITRRMVTLHGGSIKALRRPGGGMIMEIVLPSRAG